MILATFSLDWFMTIPGMLITGGVLFLIIALVIFIVTGNKKSKPKKEVVAAQNESATQAVAATQTQVVQQPTVATTEPVQPVTPAVESLTTPQPIVTETPQSVEPVSIVSQPAVETGAPIINQVPAEPAVFSAKIPEEVVPTPVVEPQTTPINEPIEMKVSESEPVEIVKPTVAVPTVNEVPTEPVVNTPSMFDTQAVEVPTSSYKAPVVENKERPIYGGVSQIVPPIPHEAAHRPIYGGANPLENTQSVPIVELNQEKLDQKPVAPTINIPTVATPSVASEPVVPTPVVEQPQPAVAPTNNIFGTQVVNNPVVNNESVQVSSTPVVEPAAPKSAEEIESLF
ncbi:MAG: hypothetical protein PUB03_03590 [bacterium]|nr:hypothetical protein [bacterium]